jgi:hypothetical protein
MQLEFHQLDRRWEHLRVRHPARQRRLLASLAESGQQTPIVAVVAEGSADRHVVIDGYKRIAARSPPRKASYERILHSRFAKADLSPSGALSAPNSANVYFRSRRALRSDISKKELLEWRQI